jgi:hypothetical protein
MDRIATTRDEKRGALRFDKVFPVWIEATEHGGLLGVARNISARGVFVETAEPLPLGTTVRVHFCFPGSDAEIVASGEIKNHCFLNFADATGPRAITGMGIRFSGFLADSEGILVRSLDGFRVLH